ncbi:30S ribosomal protein S6 modification protein RimK [Streptomyces sp. NRRL B-1568]|nr:30S ribosomal protein S6 modification protein RimK [Streptomyces sp. NRRL B-1568]
MTERAAAGDHAVLVVTQIDDATADLVIDELNGRGVPVVRLDPGDFPGAVTLNVHADDQGLGGTIATDTRCVDVTGVRAVYWRRPRPYASPKAIAGDDARWVVDQARYGLGGVLAALPGAGYVNHPWRIRDAEHKPAQLAAAARFGLRVPRTLITNDAAAAQGMAEDHGPVVYKPLWNTPYSSEDGQACSIWVTETSPAEMDDSVGATAHLFQHRVDKVADVRLTVVGRRMWAVRIDGSPGLDWRRHYDKLTYTLIDTPSAVAKAVREYLDTFGLVFGAFDFGLDLDGAWWFYECNPNGQWAWFPDPIPGQIAAALADLLQHPETT